MRHRLNGAAGATTTDNHAKYAKSIVGKQRDAEGCRGKSSYQTYYSNASKSSRTLQMTSKKADD